MENPFAPLAARPPPCHDDVNRWEIDFKLDLPDFLGLSDLDVVLDWIVSCEDLLDFKGRFGGNIFS